MRKQEIKEAFSKLQASDQLVMEVLDMKQITKQSRSIGRIVGRVAAVAAMVALVVAVFAVLPRVWEETPQLGLPTFGVSGEQTLPTDQVPATMPQNFFAAPGIAKLYSYTQQSVPAEELEKYEVTDGVDTYKPFWMEYGRGMPLNICLPEDYFPDAILTIKISVDYGSFYSDGLTDCLGKEVTIDNGERIYWKPGEELKKMKEEMNPGVFYMDFLIYANDSAIGYGVIKMHGHQLDGIPYVCYIYGCETVCYPAIDGRLQEVSKEYLLEQVEKYKDAYPDVGCSLCSE